MCLSAQQGRGTVVSERDQWSPFDPSIISARLESESSTKLFRDLAEIRMAIECQLAESAAQCGARHAGRARACG